MIIELTIKTDDNELIAKETAFSFEAAEEEFGKLQRYFEKNTEFAKNYPDSVQSNRGENNEFVEELTD